MTEQKKASKAPLLSRADLQYDYSWEASEGDNARIVGFPDNVLLNRHEGYEVLPFINRFADKHGWEKKISGHKAEWLIKEHLPSNVRSHENVRQWLESNWKANDGEWNRKVARGDIAK